MLSLGQSGRIASSCFREAAFPGRPRQSGHRDVLAPFLHFPHLTFPYFPYSVIGSLTNSMVSDRHDQRAHSDLQNDAGLQKLTSLNKSPPNHRNASQLHILGPSLQLLAHTSLKAPIQPPPPTCYQVCSMPIWLTLSNRHIILTLITVR